MLYTDGNGFPLAVKPSHLFGSTERMDVAEVLSVIVEEACRYVPEMPVGETFKRPKGLTRVNVPKEEPTRVESPKVALTSVDDKVPIVAASSNFVRSNRIELACFKVVVGLLSICLV